MTGIFCYAHDLYDIFTGQSGNSRSVFRLWRFGLVGRGGRGGRGVILFPHGVKGGYSSNNYRTTRLPCSGSVVGTFCPALKFITLTSWCITRNRKSMAILILTGCRIGLCSWCAGAAVCIILQRKSLQGWRTLEIVISRVLAVCKQGGCSL